MTFAVILAGGKGTRMGNSEMPKQFLLLGDKPIMIHTIEQFLLNQQIDKIIVCSPKEWIPYTNDILKKYLFNNDKVSVTQGGSTRNETILNGCMHIREKFGASSEHIIITHDAVRPFITQRIINENIEALKKYEVCDTVIGAIDTIIVSKDGEKIDEIPDRNFMFQGQTPQSFGLEAFIDNYNSLTDKEKEILTDACKIFIMKGKEVGCVKGDESNIKITNLYDLKIANAIVERNILND